MRSIWSGSISFGLVNIPVNLFSATNQERIDLDMLHKKDMSKIRFARVCESEEKEVPYQEIIRGYQLEDGQYVPIEKSDFEKVDVKKSKTIEIQDFAQVEQIDSIYFEKPYYLEPGKNADKPYALLRDALKKSKKAALAKFVLRNKEHLSVIKPMGRILILNQLRFQSEIRSPVDLSLPDHKFEEGVELDMAIEIVDKMSQPFRPELYKDTYNEVLQKLIDEKAKGKKVKVHGKEPEPTEVGDLMAKLKESLKQTKTQPKAAA
ncbi:Ku protein [Candidatus Curtissbacteria bacterium]|nr:Ku protein [Candidatus Curtissbacteria bacterium]